MQKINAMIVLLIFLLFSCSENKNYNTKVYENTLEGKKAKLEKIGEFVIQEDSTSLIGRIIYAKFRKGKIVVSDLLQPAIFFINTEGKIEKSIIWDKGEGPGEVKKISAFEFLDDRIFISDGGNYRWSVFDTSGSFIKIASPFINPLNRGKGTYYENRGIIETFENKLYVAIMEPQFLKELQQSNSKAFAILDSSLAIKKTFGFYDEIYSELRLNNAMGSSTIDNEGNIYFIQRPTYKINKYTSNGNFVKSFGVKGKFNVVDEDISLNTTTFRKKKLLKKFASSGAIYASNNYIFQEYAYLNDKFYSSKSIIDRDNYLKIYDHDGNYIASDIKLAGALFVADNDDNIYVYENDEPFNRTIGIYKVKIMED